MLRRINPRLWSKKTIDKRPHEVFQIVRIKNPAIAEFQSVLARHDLKTQTFFDFRLDSLNQPFSEARVAVLFAAHYGGRRTESFDGITGIGMRLHGRPETVEESRGLSADKIEISFL